MSGWEALAQDYARYHRTAGNRACHAVGIPLIVFAIVRWTLWPPYGLPAAALILPLYFAWGARRGLAMTALLALCWGLALRTSALAAGAAFAAGWAFQFVGHARFERARPAFARNLVHLLVGPAWILEELAGAASSS